MIKSSFFVATLATLSLAANVAYAEGEGEEAAAEPTTEPAADPAAEPAAAPTADAAPMGGRHISGDLLHGSMTVAKGKIIVGGGVGIGLYDGTPIAIGPDAQSVGLTVSFPGAPPLVPAFSVNFPASGIPGTSQGLWARYGINDKLDVGAGYSFAVKEFEIKGELLATAGYQVLTAKL